MNSNAVRERTASDKASIQLRAADERGRAKSDWLDSRHTFSFGHYYNARYTGFRDLLVINEDRVVPGGGFPTHSHRDREIISYVLEGALEHKDSIGTGSVIRPGEIQRMSAGKGIQHSEYNYSKSEPVHFLLDNAGARTLAAQLRTEGAAGLERRIAARPDRLA